MSVVSVVCCQIEVSATGRSLVQRSPTDCGASECDRDASIMRKLCSTGGCYDMGGRKKTLRVSVGWGDTGSTAVTLHRGKVAGRFKCSIELSG